MPPVIDVQNLHKQYGTTVAVNDISFSVEPGEIVGILGPNGAGKTTTVECLQGLRNADSGTVRVFGLDPRTQAGDLRPRIGAQLQHAALPERIKVWEALDLFASFVPGGPDWRSLLDQWGLAEKRNATFANLSGGQKQRLFVALALVNNPELVILDEMTTGLDPQARRVAWDLIQAIRDRGATVVLVTHFMDEAERLCDRLLVINHGLVVASGTPRDLVRSFAAGVQVTFSADADVSWLSRVEGVSQVAQRADGTVAVEGTVRSLPLVCAALVERRMAPDDMRVRQASLEDVYLSLVGAQEEAE